MTHSIRTSRRASSRFPAIIFNASQVLKMIAGNLDEALRDVLMEWVISGIAQKQEAVAHILFIFNDGRAFYDVSREIIARTDDGSTLNAISGAIVSTPLSNAMITSSSY